MLPLSPSPGRAPIESGPPLRAGTVGCGRCPTTGLALSVPVSAGAGVLLGGFVDWSGTGGRGRIGEASGFGDALGDGNARPLLSPSGGGFLRVGGAASVGGALSLLALGDGGPPGVTEFETDAGGGIMGGASERNVIDMVCVVERSESEAGGSNVVNCVLVRS